jgi:hypothetical protein
MTILRPSTSSGGIFFMAHGRAILDLPHPELIEGRTGGIAALQGAATGAAFPCATHCV